MERGQTALEDPGQVAAGDLHTHGRVLSDPVADDHSGLAHLDQEVHPLVLDVDPVHAEGLLVHVGGVHVDDGLQAGAPVHLPGLGPLDQSGHVLGLRGLLACAGRLVLTVGVPHKLHGGGEGEAGGGVWGARGDGGHSSSRGSETHSLEQLTNT